MTYLTYVTSIKFNKYVDDHQKSIFTRRYCHCLMMRFSEILIAMHLARQLSAFAMYIFEQIYEN